MSALFRLPRSVLYQIRSSAILRYSQKGSIEDNTSNVEIPTYEPRAAETIETKKSRLLYQSRKRGMLENDLILSTFAAKYLTEMNENQTQLYDHLINLPSNDWDLYNWATGKKPTPPEFDNEVMNMLKEHVENKNREVRLKQPSLY